MSDPVSVPATELSQVGEARRAAAALAHRLGFDATTAGQLAIIVTEAANNLVKHARDGELILTPLEHDQLTGIEVLALDRGPGMDSGRCLQDGYSTAGSPGTGLGAIVRLATSFDLHSTPSGTALLARLWAHPTAANGTAPAPDIGAVSLPVRGETACGDAWAVAARPGQHLFLVADGLGHGPLAALAAHEAVRVFRSNPGLESVPTLQAIHAALRSTRGAAVALAAVDFSAQVIHFTGVGNIAGAVVSAGASRSMVSHNGTLGHHVYKIQEFVYPFPPGALLIMHSDGLASPWRLDRYPGLAGRHPSLIAGVLYRDFKRGRDDVTVLVARAAGKDDPAA